jgi:hypothetical protein
MEQRKLPKRMEECDSNPHTEAIKNRSTTDVLTILENNIADTNQKKTINGVSRYFKGLRYVLEIKYPKKIKDWKIDGKLLHFINEFMKNRTFRVAIGNTVSEQKQIENGVVQGAVLSVTLFLVAMVEITHGIEEPIKIIGYADDWIIHTTHKHERVYVAKLQKAMDKIVKWADNTGFQISIEKTKAIMFSRKKKCSSLQTKTG